jgi:hypothetical protein
MEPRRWPHLFHSPGLPRFALGRKGAANGSIAFRCRTVEVAWGSLYSQERLSGEVKNVRRGTVLGRQIVLHAGAAKRMSIAQKPEPGRLRRWHPLCNPVFATFSIMKTSLLPALFAMCFMTSCDVKVDKRENPPSKTTIVTPGEKKVENNTTVVNPPKEEKKVENKTTIVNPPKP